MGERHLYRRLRMWPLWCQMTEKCHCLIFTQSPSIAASDAPHQMTARQRRSKLRKLLGEDASRGGKQEKEKCRSIRGVESGQTPSDARLRHLRQVSRQITLNWDENKLPLVLDEVNRGGSAEFCTTFSFMELKHSTARFTWMIPTGITESWMLPLGFDPFVGVATFFSALT